MANFVFIARVDNNWNGALIDNGTHAITEDNWNPFPGFPGAGDDATIEAGSSVVVQGTVPQTNNPDVVADLQVGSVNGTASLEIDSSLTVSGTIENEGAITVVGTLFSGTGAGAVINNDGQMTINNNGILELGQFDVELNGAGTIFMNAGSSITGTTPGVPPTLHNNSTISGIGTIGNDIHNDNSLVLAINNGAGGVINGTGQNAGDVLVLQSVSAGSPTSATPIDNAGILEGTGPGGLQILGATVRQTAPDQQASVAGGIIKADGLNANVEMDGVTIFGGTVEGINGGTVQISSGPNGSFNGSTFDGSSVQHGAVNTAGNVELHAGASLTVKGALFNAGTLTMLMDFHPAVLLVDSGGVTLNGGGTIKMVVPNGADERELITGNNAVTASALHNVDNTISGSGSIADNGNNKLILDNQASGVINGNDTTGDDFQNLTIQLSNAVQNAGTIESTGSSGLSIVGTEIDQTAIGVIGASGLNTHVDFNGATIVGGTLTTTNGGVLQTESINSVLTGAIFDGSTGAGAVILTGSANVHADHGALMLKGSIQNGGVISASSSIIIQSDTTLTGSGSIGMSGLLLGSSAAAVTLHNVNNTISGIGSIKGQSFTLTIDNQAGGSIVANSATAGDQLLIDSTSAGGPAGVTPITNAGTLKATGAAALVLEGGTIHQTGAGKILADGPNAHVTLEGATVVGGLVTTANGGVIDFNAPNGNFGTTTFDGSSGALTMAGTVNVTNTLGLTGSIVNQGTVNDGGLIEILASGVTLTGGGHIVMSVFSYNSGGFKGFDTATTTTLSNVDNTISGAGTIGFGQPFLGNSNLLTFDNQASGIVNADSADGTLTIRTGTSGVITNNAGLLEASGVQGLVIDTSRIHNTGGTIQANAGSVVEITNSQIDGGTLKTIGSGVIRFDGPATTLTGADNIGGALTFAGNIGVVGGVTLAAAGTVHNSGTLTIGTTGGATLTGGITVDGGGHIVVAANSTFSGALHNVDNTVSGSGQVTASIDNQASGVIVADTTNATLTLTTGSAIANNGVLEANVGTLVVVDDVTGFGHATVTAGGTLTFDGAFNETATFAGLGTLNLAHADSGSISGFASGDHVMLTSVASANADHLGFSASPGLDTVTVLDASNATLATLHFDGHFAASQFSLGSSGGHVDITVSGNGTGVPNISDMDGNGFNDLVFESQSTVDTLYASMPTGALVDDIFPALSGVNATQIRAAGSGDLDGNGTADVVFQIGDNIVGKAAGDIATTFSPMVFAVPDGWTVSGVGDVNGDGAADILITDATNDAGKGNTFFIDAKASFATLSTATPHEIASNLATPGASYVVRGIGDINGDGVNDVVFQNTADGDVIYADMAAVAQHVAVNNFSLNDTLHQILSPSVINASLVVKAVGDLDGDGFADLVVEQETDPNAGPVDSLVLEAHNGGNNTFAFQTAGTITDYGAFDVRGIADVNGDGIGDILMQYTQDLPFGPGGAANLHGGVIVVDPAHGATPASIALVTQTVGIGAAGADYVLL